jgi:Cupredoxin-like domain
VEADHRQLDLYLSEQNQVIRNILILSLIGVIPALDASFLVAPALADAPIAVSLQDHKFSPAIIHVKANVPSVIALTNKDAQAEEFDSTALKVEKVVAGNSSGNVRIRALAPGKYPFMGEYHSATAQGVVIAE